MKRLLVLSSAILMFLFCVNAWGAGDNEGYYNIASLTIDGSDWSNSSDTMLTAGDTYSVGLVMTYEDADLFDFDALDYEDSQTAWININDVQVWSATATSPDSKTTDPSSGEVQTAQWSLANNLVYPAPINPEGDYTASFFRSPELFPLFDGFEGLHPNITRPVNIANPVPEPATMLLLGVGLFGLIFLQKKKFFRKS